MMIAASEPIRTMALGRLRCLLRQRVTSGRAVQGEFELENLSSATIEIPVDIHPLQYLNLRVRNSAGETVSQGWYGDQFSPGSSPSTVRLLPGERFTQEVSLLATVPAAFRKPGDYTVEAFYDTPELHMVSEPLTLTIT